MMTDNRAYNVPISNVGGVWTTDGINVPTNQFLVQVKMKKTGAFKLSISADGNVYEEKTDFVSNPDLTEAIKFGGFVIGSSIKFYSTSEIESIVIKWDSLYI